MKEKKVPTELLAIGIVVIFVAVMAVIMTSLVNKETKRDKVQEAYEEMRESWRNREGYDPSIAETIDSPRK